MNQFAIFGSSGCGRSVMPLARRQLQESSQIYELVFVDDNPKAEECNGHPLLTYSEWIKRPASNRFINIAISEPIIRKKIVERCSSDDIKFFQICAENVLIFDDVKIDEGAILCPYVTITSNIRIGKHFHANLYSYVEHDCIIGDYVTFAPGVRCNGNVVIEDQVYIGSGAIIKQGKPGNPLRIGRGAIIGMGAVVTKNVPSGATIVGNPAAQINKKRV